jgi:hypothetical protein
MAGRHVGVRGSLSTPLGGEGKGFRRPRRRRGWAARCDHGEGRGRPEVGGEADRWGPLVGERRREEAGLGRMGRKGKRAAREKERKGVKRGGPAVEEK